MESKPAMEVCTTSEDPMKLRLQRALDRFECLPSKPEHKLFIEVDAAAILAPQDAIARQVRVYWPEDDAWYLGTVVSYDADTAAHRVAYEDGCIENVVLALERVRLVVCAGDPLEPAPPAALRDYADQLLSRAKTDRKNAKELKKRADELRSLADDRGKSTSKEEKGTGTDKDAAQAGNEPMQVDQGPQAPDDGIADGQGSEESALREMENGAQGLQKIIPDHEGSTMPAPLYAASNPATHAEENREREEQAVENGKSLPLHQRLKLGDVIWAKVNGFPPWPALVVTREHAINGVQSLKSRQHTAVPIVYFGTLERQLLKASSATLFREGLTQGYNTAKTRKQRHFASSLCETAAYLEDGEIPEGMFPTNDAMDEEGCDDEGDGSRAAKRRKSGSAGFNAVYDIEGGVMRVGRALTVVSLGRVEWLHPAFHNEKVIWPVGYRALRTAVTPLGGATPVEHLCEIIVAPDGSGPLFKVTPRNKPSVTGSTPNKAWLALYQHTSTNNATTTNNTTAASTVTARSLSSNGNRMFGLSLPPITEGIQNLPNASRCERYCWPEHVSTSASNKKNATGGQKAKHSTALTVAAGGCDAGGGSRKQPPSMVHQQQQQNRAAPPPLTPLEQCIRLAAAARSCKLPDGISAVSSHQELRPWACCVCGEEDEDDEDLMLQCDGCNCFVHMSCYAVTERPSGEQPWLCDTCSLADAVAKAVTGALTTSVPLASSPLPFFSLPLETAASSVGAAIEPPAQPAGHNDAVVETARMLLPWSPPVCALCPSSAAGPLKLTTCGQWVHPACALWLPETALDCTRKGAGSLQGVITGVDQIHASRRKLTCHLCKQSYGACVQCSHPSCYVAFHVSCARAAGYVTLMQEEEEDEEEGMDYVSKEKKAQEYKGSGDKDAVVDNVDVPRAYINATRNADMNDGKNLGGGVVRTSPLDLDKQQPLAEADDIHKPDGVLAVLKSSAGDGDGDAVDTEEDDGVVVVLSPVEDINGVVVRLIASPARARSLYAAGRQQENARHGVHEQPKDADHARQQRAEHDMGGEEQQVPVKRQRLERSNSSDEICGVARPQDRGDPASNSDVVVVQNADVNSDDGTLLNKKKKRKTSPDDVSPQPSADENAADVANGALPRQRPPPLPPASTSAEDGVQGDGSRRESAGLRQTAGVPVPCSAAVLRDCGCQEDVLATAVAHGASTVVETETEVERLLNAPQRKQHRGMDGADSRPEANIMNDHPRHTNRGIVSSAEYNTITTNNNNKHNDVSEGTSANAVRLLIYCSRHAPNRQTTNKNSNDTHTKTLQPNTLNGALPGINAAAAPAALLHQGLELDTNEAKNTAINTTTQATKRLQDRDDAAKAADASAAFGYRHGCGCVKAMPLGDLLERRRGHRAPEALAAAAAKRFFVQATPLLVTSGPALAQTPVGPFSSSFAAASRPSGSGDDVDAAALNGLQRHCSSCTWLVKHKQHGSVAAAKDLADDGCDENRLIESNAPAVPGRNNATTTEKKGGVLVGGAGMRSAWQGTTTPLSASQRFEMMKAMELARVTPGKSAIHGWGAFARVPHAKGDMVIEYAGEIVRPSVAEARERRSYNSLVGSGTYIFRLNANECVDATRCGNLAHLLNHSCSPNCHSRSIPVWNAAEHRTIDKVVIFAVRDIDPGEELTYDYRFCGEEVLRCDCGAKECRGTVNIGDIGGGGGGGGGGDAGNAKAMTVPKSQVRWLLSGSNEKDLH